MCYIYHIPKSYSQILKKIIVLALARYFFQYRSVSSSIHSCILLIIFFNSIYESINAQIPAGDSCTMVWQLNRCGYHGRRYRRPDRLKSGGRGQTLQRLSQGFASPISLSFSLPPRRLPFRYFFVDSMTALK